MIRLLLGYLLLAAGTVPVAVACHRLSRALVRGAWERLAVTLFLVTLQIVLSMQLLGALEAWRPLPYIVVALLGAGLVWLLAGRIRPDVAEDGEADGEGSATFPTWVKVVAVAVPVALVTAALVNLLFAADTANDSTLYHRAMVAAWYRTNTIWRIGAFENGVYEGAYWSNGDLFGMWSAIPLGRDYLLQISSLVWALGLFSTVVAAVRSTRVGTWGAVLAGSAVLCAWGVSYGQLSTFHVDLLSAQAGAFMFWAGLQWLCRGNRLRWALLAGLAAGLAAGTKQAALPFAGLCAVVLVVIALRRRLWGQAAVMVLAAAAPTVIWPLRNLVLTGNPLWPLSLGPLPGADPGYTTIDVNQSVLGLARGEPSRTAATLVFALLVAYGPLLLGIALGARRLWDWARENRVVWFGLVAPLAALASYVVTPVTGFSQTQIFISMRFVAPQVTALAIVLAAATLGEGHHIRRWRALFAAAIIYGFLTVALTHALPSVFQWPPWSWVAATVAGCLAGTALVRGWFRDVPTKRVATVCLVAAGLLVAVAAPARAAHWYPFHVGYEDAEPAAQWFSATEPTGRNIAFAGMLSGWLHGRDLSNDVYYLGKPAENHGMTYWDEQSEWERALQEACTDYLVVGSDAVKWGRPLPEFEWAAQSRILTPVELAPNPPGARNEVMVYEVQRDPAVTCSPPE